MSEQDGHYVMHCGPCLPEGVKDKPQFFTDGKHIIRDGKVIGVLFDEAVDLTKEKADAERQ